MHQIDLSDDCSSCAALCCVSYTFEKLQGFGDAKDAGTPCQYLDAEFGCSIHQKRVAMNYPGCIAYTCYGAGQRVVQDVFEGENWQGAPKVRERMVRAFLVLQKIHEAVFLLEQAGKLDLPKDKQAERLSLVEALTGPQDWTEKTLAEFERSAVLSSVRGFLKSLAAHINR